MNDKLVRVLKEIIHKFGVDSLYDGKRTIGLFADLAPECSRELNMLTYLIKCDGHKMLLDVRTNASGTQLVTRQKIIAKMTQEYLLDAAIASSICDSFWAAIGGKPMSRTEAAPKQTHQKPNTADTPQRQNVTQKSADAVSPEYGSITTRRNPQTANRSGASSSAAKQRRLNPVVIGICSALVVAIIFFVATGSRNEKPSVSGNNNHEQLADTQSAAEMEQLKATLSKYETAGNYQAIINAIKNSNYSDAEITAVYDRAVTNYESAAISEAESYAQAGDYISARSVLSVAESYIGRTSALADKMAQISERELTAQVLALMEESNYADAIILLNNNSAIVSGSPDLQVTLNTCAEKYRTDVIAEADSAYRANGFEAALSVLNSALKVLHNDSVLTSEKVKYENLAPIALVDLKTFYSDYGSDTKKVGVTLKDKLGNSYTGCIEYFGGQSIHTDNAINTLNKRDIYVLDRQYSRFKATVFVPETRSSYWDTEISEKNKSKGSFTLRIFGDGKLLYQTPLMISTQYPVEVDIDISGVDQLAFAWSTFNDVSSEIGVSNACLYKD